MNAKGATVYSRFAQQVKISPDNPAVITDSTTVTYGGLSLLVDAIARKIGPSQGRFIGIVMSHGPMQVAAMLAVLKVGAAYVPTEPTLPADRISYMMEDVGATMVITDDFCRDISPSDTPETPDLSTPDAPAYVLYTSGTTGRPKGVCIANSSVVNYAEAFEAEFRTGPGDVMLQYSVCSFDIFVEEVFTTLLNGAALAVPPTELTAAGKVKELMRFVEKHGVTIISGFPYLLAEMNKLGGALPGSQRLLISGGDVLRASYIDRLAGGNVKIYNTYGPSETTVCATYCRVDNIAPLADGTFPLGRAVKGVSVKIIDAKGHEAAQGAVGEICISGAGVSLGYIGNPPEQRNFAAEPDGSRTYHSGDLGYTLPDGSLAFVHRKDRQVMILGRRVEPDEVENVLNTSGDIERGVVRAYNDDNGLAYLVAYFVPARLNFSLARLKEHLRRKLSDFMIPEFFVALRDIPVNSRGKVDVRLLPVVLKEGCYK